jgi:RNA polymerase sigma-70 factor (ECF subfamily)
LGSFLAIRFNVNARKDDAPDEELVAAVVGGDSTAFEPLVRRYTDRVFRLARGFVKTDHEAEDIVQETFLNVFRSIDRFQGNAQFGSWIYRITVNTALMRLRYRRRRPEASLDDIGEGSDDRGHHDAPMLVDVRTAHDDVDRSQVAARIQNAVDELDEMYRVVFVMRDIDGLSILETAEALGLTEAAVKSRLHRARLQLRAALEPYVR